MGTPSAKLAPFFIEWNYAQADHLPRVRHPRHRRLRTVKPRCRTTRARPRHLPRAPERPKNQRRPRLPAQLHALARRARQRPASRRLRRHRHRHRPHSGALFLRAAPECRRRRHDHRQPQSARVQRLQDPSAAPARCTAKRSRTCAASSSARTSRRGSGQLDDRRRRHALRRRDRRAVSASIAASRWSPMRATAPPAR